MTTKAQGLMTMQDLGLNVPYFKIIDHPLTYEEFQDLDLNDKFLNDVSVRSSGNISTPGRMKTILNVKFNYYDLSSATKEIFKSSKDDRLLEYLKSIDYDDKNFKVQCIIQNQIPVRKHTGDHSAIIHAKFDSDEYEMEWYNCPGDRLMDGSVIPNSTLITSIHPLFYKIQFLTLRYQSDIEVELTFYNGLYYFLQCRPTNLNIKQSSNTTSEELLFARYWLNLNQEMEGILTENIDYHSPEEAFYLTDDTSFDDLEKLLKFKAIITMKGGKMCHAAAICRIHNKPLLLSVVRHDKLIENQRYKINTNGEIISI